VTGADDIAANNRPRGTDGTDQKQEKAMNDVIHGGDHNTPARARGRLIFALDSTASREATWELARELQADMFRKAAPIGRLDAQLLFYGGGTCRHTKWVSSGDELARLMGKIVCDAGTTQIGLVLDHVLREHAQAPVQALTFIGDAVEEELDVLVGKALQLGAAGIPGYFFQEGRNPVVRNAFRLLALKSGGEYFEFNPDKPRAVELLSEQLNAVARLAVGDVTAITDQRKK
jgi:hypothetical protein